MKRFTWELSRVTRLKASGPTLDFPETCLAATRKLYAQDARNISLSHFKASRLRVVPRSKNATVLLLSELTKISESWKYLAQTNIGMHTATNFRKLMLAINDLWSTGGSTQLVANDNGGLHLVHAPASHDPSIVAPKPPLEASVKSVKTRRSFPKPLGHSPLRLGAMEPTIKILFAKALSL